MSWTKDSLISVLQVLVATFSGRVIDILARKTTYGTFCTFGKTTYGTFYTPEKQCIAHSIQLTESPSRRVPGR